MTLTLQIENFHVLDDGGPVSILVPETGIQVGRRSGMDWVLPDASRYISGHHFDVSFDGGKWSLLDRSTNGTFLQGHRHRLDGPHPLAHGDRFQVGQYVIVALFDLQQGRGMTPGSLPAHRVDSPVVEPISDDPWAVGAVHEPIEVYPAEAVRHSPDFSRDFVPFTAPEPEAAPTPAPKAPVATVPPVSPAALTAVNPDEPSAILRAFCEGAGLSIEYAKDVPTEELARALGQSLRSTTTHIMAALQDRAAARHFTRAGERTMRGADNNPQVSARCRTGHGRAVPAPARRLSDRRGRVRCRALGSAAAPKRAVCGIAARASGPAEDLDPSRIDAEAKGNQLIGNKKSKCWDDFVAR
ncbi:MAG: type VI secretion system-associated FHA domain protein TagH [Paracoccus sp. (in: a-proteobacteria)]